MFPTFVNSFSEQFNSVLINLVGTVLGSMFTLVFGSFTTNVLGPFFKSLAEAMGLPT
jgi:hypothetical protein